MGGPAASKTSEPVASFREVAAIARVSGQEVPPERFNALLDAMLRNSRLGDGSVPEPIQRAIKLELAERLIQERLIEEAASERGLFAQEADVDAALARFKAGFDSESDFERAVARYPLGLGEIRQRLSIQWLRDRLVEVEFPPLTEEAVQSYYKSDPARFDELEHCLARDIFLRSDRQDTALEHRTKRARAEQLRKEARSSEKPFEALARQYSEDPSAAKGGDMGRVTSQLTDPRLWEALSRLKPGGISEVVETDDGFHILSLIERNPPVHHSFAEVKPQVWAEFHGFMRRQRTKALMIQLGERAQVSNLLAQRLGAPPLAGPSLQGVPAHAPTPSHALAPQASPPTAPKTTFSLGSQPLDL